jgi:class 3 adenylate cyclase
MERYPTGVAAARAGVSVAQVERLTELGLLEGDDTAGYSGGDVRRIQLVLALERAGLPLEGLSTLVRAERFPLGFIDSAGEPVFAPLSDVTFAELAERTGLPVETILVLRDATGGVRAAPGDRVREDELRVLPLLEMQAGLGFQPAAMERALRVYGDSLRRIAEAESEWWRSEFQDPMLARGLGWDAVARRAGEVSPGLSRVVDEAILAIFHAQQQHAWSTNIVTGFAMALEQAGLHAHEERWPAMAFLDLTGFTSITQERGDAVAASLAEQLNRRVQHIAVAHGGRPVKWLGDGVMCHYPDPTGGVLASIQMVEELPATGLPPVHVGLHSGPVIRQEGDYYGGTVNLASRIGEYARAGEVLVSGAVVEAARDERLEYRPIGPVGLKGVAGLVELYTAQRRD